MDAAAAAAAGPAITPVKRRLVGSPGLPSPEKSNYARVDYSRGATSTKLVQIQGDPMLSETSAVIGAQKEIESAYRPGEEEPAMVSGQQWGHEWTYGGSS